MKTETETVTGRCGASQKSPARLVRGAVLQLALLIALCTFCACLRPMSVERCGYVVAIGIDAGSEREFEITLELQRESVSEAQTDGGSLILSCEARDVFEAVSILAANAAYDLNFTRTHLFIIGEALAREGRLGEVLNLSYDVLRIRKSALMVIARCPVRDYIGGLASNNTANVAKMQDALISNVETTGETAAINLSLFFEAVEDGRFDPVMPIGYYDESIITDMKQRDSAKKGENPIADAQKGDRIGGMQGITKGCALFDGETMCAELDEAETRLMNLVRGDYRRGTFAYPLENGKTASLLVFPNKREITVELGGEKPGAVVKLRLSITVERDPGASIVSHWEAGERERLASYLSGELERVFIKCRQAGSDAMGFGRYASMRFFSTEAWEAYGWKRVYPSLEVRFEVEPTLDDEYMTRHGG